MAESHLIDTLLTSPDGVVWQGPAETITSTNSEGLFDLYADHARFMTLLEGVDLTIRPPEGPEQVFHIEKAVLLFQDAAAKIYLHKHIDPKAK